MTAQFLDIGPWPDVTYAYTAVTQTTPTFPAALSAAAFLPPRPFNMSAAAAHTLYRYATELQSKSRPRRAHAATHVGLQC